MTGDTVDAGLVVPGAGEVARPVGNKRGRGRPRKVLTPEKKPDAVDYEIPTCIGCLSTDIEREKGGPIVEEHNGQPYFWFNCNCCEKRFKVAAARVEVR